jgi:hypothetical protein
MQADLVGARASAARAEEDWAAALAAAEERIVTAASKAARGVEAESEAAVQLAHVRREASGEQSCPVALMRSKHAGHGHKRVLR